MGSSVFGEQSCKVSVLPCVIRKGNLESLANLPIHIKYSKEVSENNVFQNIKFCQLYKTFRLFDYLPLKKPEGKPASLKDILLLVKIRMKYRLYMRTL